jgi:hypothetical protein
VWYGVDVATVLALVRLHVYRPTSNVRSEWLFTFDPSEEFDHPRNNMAAAGTTSPNPVQITNKSTMSADSNIVSFQGPWLARPSTRTLDPSRHDHWRSARQLRSQYRTSVTERQIRRSVYSNR